MNLQAYIVACGDLRSPSCCHIVLEDFHYNFVSLIEATDCLFKMFHVLKLDYPYACSYVWSYIHKNMYNFNDNFKKCCNVEKVSIFHADVLKMASDAIYYA